MSRWINQFKEHAFQEVWTTILVNLENIEIDEMDVTLFEELARLKKIVTYIDEILKQLDAELIPQTVWGTFHANINNMNGAVSQCVLSSEQTRLSQANIYADACLVIIQPYLVNCDCTDPLREAVQKSVDVMGNYTNIFSQQSDKILADIKTKQQAIDLISEQLNEKQTEIDTFSLSLFGDETSQGIKYEVEELKKDFEEKQTEINVFYNETLVDNDGGSKSTESQILEFKNTSESDAEQIRELVEEATEEVDDLKTFHNKVYGEIPEGETERQGGLASFLETQQENLTSFQEAQQTRYTALNAEIETLLPGATSAGLAVAYKEMKDSFEDKIKHSSVVFYVSVGRCCMIKSQ